MTSATLAGLATTRPRVGTAVVVATGCALLVLRPVLFANGHSTAIGITLFGLLAAAGIAWPVGEEPAVALALPRRALVVGVGVAAFAAARAIGGGEPPAPALLEVMALNSLAAVAEEAFFRRLAFDALRERGELFAIVATALLFAVVHITVYGFWVLPLDLAAGLVFGWQRSAGRSWTVPAVTHVIANLLVVLP
jgi:membrane protease YdiL (CAAX protease family)